MVLARRTAKPAVSASGSLALTAYADELTQNQDMQPTTIRNYGSDLRLFVAWYETGDAADPRLFSPAAITTATLTRYRAYLQTDRGLKAASINRSLVTLKNYFGWGHQTGQLAYNPARAIKLVGQDAPAPRHLAQEEEDALEAAVTQHGSIRDRTLILVLLHTGLRAGEVCQLKRDQVSLVRPATYVRVLGKGNKYRDVPLNATARTALTAYLATLAPAVVFVFPSAKTGQALTERALGHLMAKYAALAAVPDLSPPDLCHRFGYRMAQHVPLHHLAQLMGHTSLDTTLVYTRATRTDLQHAVATIAWT